MGKYGEAALLAVNLYRERSTSSPIHAWEMAVAAIFPFSKPAQVRSCPRSAFLGLCESGSISEIPAGIYCNSVTNKKYALKGLALLRQKPLLSSDEKLLWQHVIAEDDNANKMPNHQMEVVTAIWNAGLIRESPSCPSVLFA